jgi:elongation factor G
MDRTGADFLRVVEQIETRLGAFPVPVQLAMGAEEDFSGIVDLVRMESVSWNDADLGVKPSISDISADMLDIAEEWREKLLESVAESSEELMDKYLEEGDLSENDILSGLRIRVLAGELIPVYCGSAFKNKGVQALLDGIINYLPSPLDVPAVEGVFDGKTVIRKADDREAFSALAFKVATDPFVGSLTFFRVYSGVFDSGKVVFNPRKATRERITRILQMHSNLREEVKEVRTGDIVAAVGLKDVITGDTLCDLNQIITLEAMDFPEPVISVAVEAKTTADQDKLAVGLNRLTQEDPTFAVKINEETGQTILSGMGELHLDIKIDIMRRTHGVEVEVGKPKVAYRETITQRVEDSYTHKKQSGGSGQYGKIDYIIEPGEAGEGYTFESKVTGGNVPREFWPAVEKGFGGMMGAGVLADFPCLDVKVTLVDGAFHAVDSSAIAFELASRGAFRQSIPQAGPQLIEPVMKVDVFTPDAHVGDVIGDLNRRRGMIKSQDSGITGVSIKCDVPLSEMFGYIGDLRTMTSGRGQFSMEFSHYSPCPKNISEEVIKEVKEREAAKKKKK